MINKANYRTHRGHSAISEIEVATDSASILSSTAVPALVGMIAPFSMETTTEWRSTNRWIICDGSPISRTAYNHLFDAIGTTWGVGDGSGTFNLPDLQGAFLRGIGNGSFSGRIKFGVNNVGTFQEDEMQAHGHWATSFSGDTNDFAAGSTNSYGWRAYNGTDYFRLVGGFHNAGGGNSNPATGAEVRVYNAGIQYCIKY
jgi:phage-related tail fiber protein